MTTTSSVPPHPTFLLSLPLTDRYFYLPILASRYYSHYYYVVLHTSSTAAYHPTSTLLTHIDSYPSSIMETLRKATGTASRAFFGDDESRKSAGKGTSEKQVESGSQPPESESERQPEVERQLEPEKEPKYEQQPEPERGHEPPVERPPQSEPVSAPQQEQRDTKLKEHAATAALYHKEQPDAKPKAGKKQSVDEHRLSAAGKCLLLRFSHGIE